MPGEASMRALLFHMCSITGMKEKQLLSKHCREFERARWSMLGNGADLLLKRFSDNLSRNVDADGLGTAEVLDAIRGTSRTCLCAT